MIPGERQDALTMEKASLRPTRAAASDLLPLFLYWAAERRL
jgi:hypothetical protein